MTLPKALLSHAWLVLRLRHDGTGMPKQIPAALMLALLYVALSIMNADIPTKESAGTFIALCFAVHCYVFALRNPLIGLIFLIGILSNLLTLVLSTVAPITESQNIMIAVIEFLMISAAVVNVIKRETRVI